MIAHNTADPEAPSSPSRERPTRVGAAALMLGVVAAFAGFAIGPMVPDPSDLGAVVQGFAEAPARSHLHSLGISFSTLLLLFGYVALFDGLVTTRARRWARPGVTAAAVMTVIHLLGATLGGQVLPTLAAQALDGGPDGSAFAVATASTYVLYEALLAPTFLTLSMTTALFACALIASQEYPSSLGWAGLVPAAWTAAGGVAFLVVGPLQAAELLMWFIPGFMLAMVWVFAVGATMWRRARTGQLRSE